MTRRFTVTGTNNAFTCVHCERQVQALQNGSVRNHCPHCLHSLHVDIDPGDRAHHCQGLLEPIGVDSSGKKGWIIVHRCAKCFAVKRNKAALDDLEQPDDFDVIVALSAKSRAS